MSAIHAIRPFLIYRIVIVLLALQIRHGIIAVQVDCPTVPFSVLFSHHFVHLISNFQKRRAIQRLYFRITGENLPMDRHQYFVNFQLKNLNSVPYYLCLIMMFSPIFAPLLAVFCPFFVLFLENLEGQNFQFWGKKF